MTPTRPLGQTQARKFSSTVFDRLTFAGRSRARKRRFRGGTDTQLVPPNILAKAEHSQSEGIPSTNFERTDFSCAIFPDFHSLANGLSAALAKEAAMISTTLGRARFNMESARISGATLACLCDIAPSTLSAAFREQ